MSRIARVERAVERALTGRTGQEAVGHRDEKRSGRLQSLQRSVGNRAVGRLLTNGGGPSRAAVDPDPAQEREAERVGEQVGRTTRADDVASITERSRRSDTATMGGSGDDRRVRAGPAKPLPPAERSFFERRLGHDFRDVRVHTGLEADAAARSIGATAFTVGSDLVFSRGAYRPASAGGRDLLAHELAHVVQQDRGRPMIQRQEAAESKSRDRGGNADILGYPYLRRVEISVDPAPVIVRSFEVTKAPGEPGRTAQQFITERIQAGDEAMRRAAEEARLTSPWEEFFESRLPIPTVTTPEELEEARVRKTLRLYKQYREYLDQSDLKIPSPPGPLETPKPEPERRLYFEFDSTEFSELTTQADWEETVAQVVAYVRHVNEARSMGMLPADHRGIPVITVTGYASPEGDKAHNQRLSERRAAHIAERLATKLAAAGFGADEYIVYGIGKGELEPELFIY